VDDTRSIRERMCELLHAVGIQRIDEADDGASALERFRAFPYDVVVTDWNMPRVSGLELLRAIRLAPERRDTPVLVVTGEVTTRRVVEAIEAGADGFIAKPFITGALPEKLLRIVSALPPVTDGGPTGEHLGGTWLDLPAPLRRRQRPVPT
jgi:two-component system chemotaxis response regulator CheY